MPTYEVEVNGETFEIDAPDDAAVQLAVRQLQAGQGGQQPSMLADVGQSLAAGVARGAAGLAGLPGDIREATRSGVSGAAEWLGLSPETAQTVGNVASFNPFTYFSPTTEQGRAVVDPLGADYQPATTAGRFAGTVGEFLPSAAAGGGLGAGNLIRFGVLPGAASEAAGMLTEGTNIEPYARVAAALAAPAVPALASRAISPFSGSISPERMRAVETLRSEGVQPTAGQITGSRALRATEAELGGGRAAELMDDQARAFTEAATRRAGIDGLADPQNLRANRERLGTAFRDISARNEIVSDTTFGRDVGKVLNEYDRVLPTAQRDVVNNLADDIINTAAANNGRIPGDIYQETRSRLSRMAQNARNSDPEYAGALRGLRDSLDDAATRSISPDDAAEWSKIREQWGVQRRLENAAAGAGERAAAGYVSPAALRQAASTGRRGQYSLATGPVDELARAGNQVLTPLPDSGTAGRLRAQNLGAPLLAGGGALAGGVPGLLVGLAAPRVVGGALMSGPGQAYLTNQLAPRLSLTDARTLAVINALRGDQ